MIQYVNRYNACSIRTSMYMIICNGRAAFYIMYIEYIYACIWNVMYLGMYYLELCYLIACNDILFAWNVLKYYKGLVFWTFQDILPRIFPNITCNYLFFSAPAWGGSKKCSPLIWVEMTSDMLSDECYWIFSVFLS